MALIEICAASLASALAAQEGGADRIELCAGIELGGITPSPALLKAARRRVHLPIAVLVRPRGGDFFHSDLEFELIKEDILFCKNEGIDAVVVGVLKSNGAWDWDKMAYLRDLAYPLDVVAHRAFDVATDDALEAVEALIGLGYDRLLSSGKAPTVPEGLSLLRGMVEQAAGRLTVMPGGGIRIENLENIIKTTQATDFHLTAKMPKGMETAQYWESDLDQIRQAVAMAHQF